MSEETLVSKGAYNLQIAHVGYSHAFIQMVAVLMVCQKSRLGPMNPLLSFFINPHYLFSHIRNAVLGSYVSILDVTL